MTTIESDSLQRVALTQPCHVIHTSACTFMFGSPTEKTTTVSIKISLVEFILASKCIHQFRMMYCCMCICINVIATQEGV